MALATVIAAYLADCGLDVSDTVIYGIIGVGAAIIGGIAIEDAGIKRAGVTAVGAKMTGVAIHENRVQR